MPTFRVHVDVLVADGDRNGAAVLEVPVVVAADTLTEARRLVLLTFSGETAWIKCCTALAPEEVPPALGLADLPGGTVMDESRPERVAPSLLSLIRLYGAYAAIPRSAWALWDQELAAYRRACAKNEPYSPPAESDVPNRPDVAETGHG